MVMKNINTIERITLVFVFILVIIGVILSHGAPEFFKGTYVVEDGLIQWLQVAALIMTMCLCFRRVVFLRKTKPAIFLAATLLLGLLFLFAVGIIEKRGAKGIRDAFPLFSERGFSI